jgi:predicted metal-dependent peptidase
MEGGIGMADEKKLDAAGLKILQTARNELYLSLPFLDTALCGLAFAPSGGTTLSAATDGETLYYNSNFLSDRFLRSPTLVNRCYLHVILHCMLRHLAKKHGRNGELWDLACDIAVESILDGLDYPCLGSAGSMPLRQSWYGTLRREMPVLTAEGVYRGLLRRELDPFTLAKLQREFLADDHGLWDPESREQKDKSDRQDQKWQGMSEKTQTGLETVLAGQATGGEAVYEQVRAENRTCTDYRKFLRRFAVPREIMAVDGDAFDYIFYTYGLQLYGNLPLIEPPETKEEKRIEDFVIAIDTSMSTSGALVRQFLDCTYSILKSTETFTRKVNIRILQCDDQLRSDRSIHDLSELRDYMEHVELIGGSATDFRPVFAHVAELTAAGAFTHLRGLLYFTDGMGIYPKKRPPYDTAFVMMESPAAAVDIPPWAIQLTLTEPELEKAVQQTQPDNERDEDELRELPEL